MLDDTPPQDRADDEDDGLDFLPDSDAPAWSPEVANTELANLGELLVRFDKEAGEQAHLIGTKLATARARKAHRVLGSRTIKQLAKAKFGLEPEKTAEFTRISVATTAHEAHELGYSVIEKGIRLLDLLELDTFDELRDVELELESGETTRFPAPRETLESAIRVLAANARKTAQDAVPRRERSRIRRMNQAFAEHVKETPALKGVRGRYFFHEGEILFRLLTPVNAKQRLALSRAFAEVERT